MHTYTVESVLREHGPEIYGWMIASLATEAEAADAFSLFSEDLWRSLARHQGRCSMRTWCYMLARSSSARRGRAGSRSSRRPTAASRRRSANRRSVISARR